MCCAVNTSLASRHHISRADKPVMMLMVSAGAQAVVEAAQVAWHALIRAPVALQIVIAMTLLLLLAEALHNVAQSLDPPVHIRCALLHLELPVDLLAAKILQLPTKDI